MQLTFGDTIDGFPSKLRLGIECRNSTLMTGQFPDLGKASDLDCEQSLFFLKFSEGSASARER